MIYRISWEKTNYDLLFTEDIIMPDYISYGFDVESLIGLLFSDDIDCSLITQINQIDTEQFEKILGYIRSGVEGGATLETGGERLGNKGYYIKPTVFSNVQVHLLISSISPRRLKYIGLQSNKL